MKLLKHGFAVFVSACLLSGTACDVFADQADQSVAAPAHATQQTPEQLQQLVAPIALYPDALVAQILPASTYTVEIVEADRWMQAHPDLKKDALAVEVNRQSWDPSVQALTEFPSVLANMDRNLAWTSSLGDAWLSQPQDLMAAIQTMRQRAQQAGNLQSTDQETVTTQGQSITIEPATPDVVYVPEYDPWLTYGAPIAVWPGWYPYSGLYLDAPGIVFGAGFALGYFGGYRWGWRHWRPDWNHRAIVYNHGTYVPRARMYGDRSNYFHGREYFNRGPEFHGAPGFSAGPQYHESSASPHAFMALQPGLADGSGRSGSFGSDAFDRGHLGGGRPGFREFGHGGGEFHGGGDHGGEGHR